MMRTDETPMYQTRFKTMVDRCLMVDRYESAEAMVEAFLAADHAVRDGAKVPLMGRILRDRMRREMLLRIAQAGVPTDR